MAGATDESNPELLLLADRFAPITSEIGFIRAPLESVVREYLDWQGSLETYAWSAKTVEGDMPNLIETLLPMMVPGPTRNLFIPTTGDWTACLNNFRGGTDVVSINAVLGEKLDTAAIRAVATQSIPIRDGVGQFGSVQLALRVPDTGEQPGHERVIGATNDGGRWRFDDVGEHLSFEEPARYEARRIADRFTFAMLGRYLAALGVDAFDHRAYAPENRAVLVERPPVPADPDWPYNAPYREFSLQEERAARALSTGLDSEQTARLLRTHREKLARDPSRPTPSAPLRRRR